MNSNSLVSMKNISKSFGSIEALKNANFDLNKGEILGLAGDNGAGKSTLVKILAGVFPYDSGKIFLEGKKVTTVPFTKFPSASFIAGPIFCRGFFGIPFLNSKKCSVLSL